MNRRRLLGALSTGLVATSGCLSEVETPPLGKDPERPPLKREDFVSDMDTAQREAVMPNVSLLSVSTAVSDGSREEPRVVQGPQTTTGPSNESGTKSPSTESTTTTNSTNSTNTTNTTTTSTTKQASKEPANHETVTAPNRDFGEPGLYVTDEFWRYRTHVHHYAVDEVTTTVYPMDPSNEEPMKVLVAAYVYPRGGLVDSVESESFRPMSEAKQVTVPMDLSAAPEGTPLQYVAVVVPESVDREDVAREDLFAIMETDPFVVKNEQIERASDAASVPAASGKAFERTPVEGGYVQTLRGRTNGEQWEVSFLAFRSAYAAATNRSRGRARAEYVSFELMEGAANEIARFLYDAAENNGFTSGFERIQFVLSFVQRLPYVPDSVTSGYDDYTQFIMETLTQLAGDCEDTSILFASIMESRPFNYDAVLLEPPGHMAVGLLMSDDFDGFAYIYDERKYYYVETTTEGWGIGQIPDVYRDSKAQIYDV